MLRKMPRIVYILTNPSLKEIKIGKTRNLKKRIADLSRSSGIPNPYECYYACEVEDECEVERSLKFIFEEHRANKNREFYMVKPEKVKAVLKLVEIRDITPSKKEFKNIDALEETKAEKLKIQKGIPSSKKNPKKASTFGDLKVPFGSVLKFSKDETITCAVIDDRKVRFEGKASSLSTVATEILRTKFGQSKTSSVNGFSYFKFEDEILTDRRNRMENET